MPDITWVGIEVKLEGAHEKDEDFVEALAILLQAQPGVLEAWVDEAEVDEE